MSELLTVRFPSGATEYRTAEQPPRPGDIVRSKGGEWTVHEVVPEADGSFMVRLASASPSDADLSPGV